MDVHDGVDCIGWAVGELVEGLVDDGGDGAEVELVGKECFDGGFVGGVEDGGGTVVGFDGLFGEGDGGEALGVDGGKVEGGEGGEVEGVGLDWGSEGMGEGVLDGASHVGGAQVGQG